MNTWTSKKHTGLNSALIYSWVSNLDKKVTNLEAIHFLPDYLFKGMDSAYSGKKPLVSAKTKIIEFPCSKTYPEGLTPMALFQCLLLGLIILFMFRMSPTITKTILIFDIVFFSCWVYWVF